MAKRKRKLNINELIKKGNGKGISSKYKSWIGIQDVPSLGRSIRLIGFKV
ncbi:hypothetical protein KQI89_08640 [Clostridium sp. MSJ-4]|uniref:Uncharacterized protein n=1 Tax=Clostridium simiarum TaxID=2841506 RepID=A0ABS6F2Q8_9CLOT|nr:hypothetical protein [Clostridium simiarum]MBU5591832.1 hypothetical protein [Clostridium simiarum]